MIHPSRTPMWDAVPRKTARAITFNKLADLRGAVHGFAGALCADDGYSDPAKVKANLQHFGLAASDLEQRWTQKFTEAAAK